MRGFLHRQPGAPPAFPAQEGGWGRGVLLQAVLLLWIASIVLAQQQEPALRGWQKAWDVALPADTLSASLVDFSGEGQVRLVTLHTDSAKEDVLHLRIWKREGEKWEREWQAVLDPGELRGMVTGCFVKGSRAAQVLTSRNLVVMEGKQYSKRTRKEEVSWFACAFLRDWEEVPVAAYPGGVWRGVLNLSSREEWLRFERLRTDSLLSLPQQFGTAQWVSLVTPLAFHDLEMENWAQQGYDRLFAQVGKAWHPQEPLLVSRAAGEGKQSLALVVPPTLSAPMQVLWQSEPIEGTIKEARLISVPSLRGALLILIGNTTGCRVQFWQRQREGIGP